jgi:hypothetical protein
MSESLDNNRGRTGRFSCHIDFRLTALSPFDIGCVQRAACVLVKTPLSLANESAELAARKNYKKPKLQPLDRDKNIRSFEFVDSVLAIVSFCKESLRVFVVCALRT